MGLGDRTDERPVLLTGQADPGVATGGHRLVAAVAAEDEPDRRQQALGIEALNRLHLARHGKTPPPASLPTRSPVTGVGGRIEAVALRVGAAVDEQRQKVVLRGAAVGDQVQRAQLHRALVLDHRASGPPQCPNPLAELFGVGHRGRQPHQLGARRRVDDHLLPGRPPLGVGQVVHLVHDDHAQTRQVWAGHVNHVAQHFGGHDDQVGRAVDRVVAGEQADPASAPAGRKVTELLVGQRLDRGGVERPTTLGEGPVNGVLGHEGLAGAGRSRHQDRLAVVDRLDRPQLELIGDDRVAGVAHDRRAFSRRRTIRRPARIDAS